MTSIVTVGEAGMCRASPSMGREHREAFTEHCYSRTHSISFQRCCNHSPAFSCHRIRILPAPQDIQRQQSLWHSSSGRARGMLPIDYFVSLTITHSVLGTTHPTQCRPSALCLPASTRRKASFSHDIVLYPRPVDSSPLQARTMPCCYSRFSTAFGLPRLLGHHLHKTDGLYFPAVGVITGGAGHGNHSTRLSNQVWQGCHPLL